MTAPPTTTPPNHLNVNQNHNQSKNGRLNCCYVHVPSRKMASMWERSGSNVLLPEAAAAAAAAG